MSKRKDKKNEVFEPNDGVLDEDIFSESGDIPIEPDIFKETDTMPLDMEAERARQEALAKEKEEPVEPDIFDETDTMPLDMEAERARQEALAMEKEPEEDSDEVEDIDLGSLNITEAENEYREEEEGNKGQTRIITNTVVKEVIRNVPAGKNKGDSVEDDREKTEEEKMVDNIAAVINDSASTKLSKYERRRKHRNLRKRLWFCAKVIAMIAIGVTLYRNDVVREKVAIISTDIVDLVTRIKNNDEDKSSNKLVEDALNMMGTDMEEVGEKYIDLLETETEE